MKLAIQSDDNRHLGFVFFHFSAASSGECVFVAAPKEPGLMTSAPYKRLVTHRDLGEHQFEVIDAVGGRTIQIAHANNLFFVIELGSDGTGKMSAGPGQDHVHYQVKSLPGKA
jgi:hypothetical protein